MGEFNVNKSDGSLEQTAGMPSEYPATQVMMSDGTTSVEEKLEDSGWIQPTKDIYYRKKNGFVAVKAMHIMASSSWETVFTLPEGYRPSIELNMSIYSSNDTPALGRIQTNGKVEVYAVSGIQAVIYTMFPVN